MEEKGEVPFERRLSATTILKNTLRSFEQQLQAGAPDVEKAPSYTTIMLIAPELMIISDEDPIYVRIYAWVLLIRVWASLRCDDTVGVRPAHVRLTELGLEGRLDRTKTSGPGRCVRRLHFFVSRQAYVGTQSWLATGYDLWRHTFRYERDYMLPAIKAEDADGDISWSKRPPAYRDCMHATSLVWLRQGSQTRPEHPLPDVAARLRPFVPSWRGELLEGASPPELCQQYRCARGYPEVRARFPGPLGTRTKR